MDSITDSSNSSYEKSQTICLAVLATAVVTYMIFWLRPVLLPFVVALFVVSGVTPILETLESRLHVNRLVAAGLTFLAGLVALCIMGISIFLSVLQMADKGAAYRSRVGQLIVYSQQWMPFSTGSSLSPEPGAQVPRAQATDQSDASDSAGEPQPRPSMSDSVPNVAVSQETNKTLEEFRKTLDAFLRDGFTRVSTELFGLASTSVVVLIYVFFLLLGSSGVKLQGSGTFREIDSQVRSYLFMKTIISIATGGAFGFALWMMGVPMALTFGVLAFLLNYIPNVGPLVASVLPVPFILLDPSGGIVWMVAAISITSGIQVVSGNVIEPQLMGDSSDLHPVVILLGLMFWGMMWGITGMFLATPIVAGTKIVLSRFDATQSIAEIMAGRWGALDELHTSASE